MTQGKPWVGFYAERISVSLTRGGVGLSEGAALAGGVVGSRRGGRCPTGHGPLSHRSRTGDTGSRRGGCETGALGTGGEQVGVGEGGGLGSHIQMLVTRGTRASERGAGNEACNGQSDDFLLHRCFLSFFSGWVKRICHH